MSIRLRSGVPAYGIDLSDASIKVVQLTAGKQPKIVVAETAAMPDGALQAGDIIDEAQAAQAITALLSKHHAKLSSAAVVSLPETKTFVQTISVPKHGAASFQDQLRQALPQYLPLPLLEAVYDASILHESSDAWTVYVGAAPKKVVDAYVRLLERARVPVIALDVQASALARACIPVEKERRIYAIVDIGQHWANLILVDAGAVQFTVSLPVSGNAITEQLASTLSITQEQAEEAKRMCGIDPKKCEGVIGVILQDLVTTLIKRISAARDFFQDHFPAARDFDAIILCGGGSTLFNLDATLAQALHVPVRLANPAAVLGLSETPVPSLLPFSAAIGLAARGDTIDSV